MKINARAKAAFLPGRSAAYAAAAGATALGTATAEAEIHYSGPIREKLDPHLHSSIDKDYFALNNGASFSLYVISSMAAHQYSYAGFRIKNAPVSHAFRAAPFYSYVARLPAGQPVSAGRFSSTNSGFYGAKISAPTSGAGSSTTGGRVSLASSSILAPVRNTVGCE